MAYDPMIYDYLRRSVEIDPALCFVLVPFNTRGNELFACIQPAVEAVSMECRRADQHLSSSPIMFQIFDDIMRAQVVVADLTEPNPNVYYEVGLAHALKPHVILLSAEGAPVPFDLHSVRHVTYTSEGLLGPDRLRTALHEALVDVLREVSAPPGIRDTQSQLRRATKTWFATRDVILPFERYLEIGLALPQLTVTEEDVVFLAHAGANFGRFIGSLCSRFCSQRHFVRALVEEAAASPYVRVPWRAAAMLEHCDDQLVAEELRVYSGPNENTSLFPDAIRTKQVVPLLKAKTEEEGLGRDERYKYIGVLKQVRSEFPDGDSPSNRDEGPPKL